MIDILTFFTKLDPLPLWCCGLGFN